MAAEIRDLGHGAYLVDGEVIWIQEHAIDPNTEEGREYLIRSAQSMKTDDPLIFHRVCGPLTMEIVFPKRHNDDGMLYTAGPAHYHDLPDDCRKILREAFPGYASEI